MSDGSEKKLKHAVSEGGGKKRDKVDSKADKESKKLQRLQDKEKKKQVKDEEKPKKSEKKSELKRSKTDAKGKSKSPSGEKARNDSFSQHKPPERKITGAATSELASIPDKPSSSKPDMRHTVMSDGSTASSAAANTNKFGTVTAAVVSKSSAAKRATDMTGTWSPVRAGSKSRTTAESAFQKPAKAKADSSSEEEKAKESPMSRTFIGMNRTLTNKDMSATVSSGTPERAPLIGSRGGAKTDMSATVSTSKLTLGVSRGTVVESPKKPVAVVDTNAALSALDSSSSSSDSEFEKEYAKDNSQKSMVVTDAVVTKSNTDSFKDQLTSTLEQKPLGPGAKKQEIGKDTKMTATAFSLNYTKPENGSTKKEIGDDSKMSATIATTPESKPKASPQLERNNTDITANGKGGHQREVSNSGKRDWTVAMKQGYLEKVSPNDKFGLKLQKRFFVFKDSQMKYYKSDSDTKGKPLGVLTLVDFEVSLIPPDTALSKVGSKFAFEINDKEAKHPFTLVGASEFDVKDWVELLWSFRYRKEEKSRAPPSYDTVVSMVPSNFSPPKRGTVRDDESDLSFNDSARTGDRRETRTKKLMDTMPLPDEPVPSPPPKMTSTVTEAPKSQKVEVKALPPKPLNSNANLPKQNAAEEAERASLQRRITFAGEVLSEEESHDRSIDRSTIADDDMGDLMAMLNDDSKLGNLLGDFNVSESMSPRGAKRKDSTSSSSLESPRIPVDKRATREQLGLSPRPKERLGSEKAAKTIVKRPAPPAKSADPEPPAAIPMSKTSSKYFQEDEIVAKDPEPVKQVTPPQIPKSTETIDYTAPKSVKNIIGGFNQNQPTEVGQARKFSLNKGINAGLSGPNAQSTPSSNPAPGLMAELDDLEDFLTNTSSSTAQAVPPPQPKPTASVQSKVEPPPMEDLMTNSTEDLPEDLMNLVDEVVDEDLMGLIDEVAAESSESSESSEVKNQKRKSSKVVPPKAEPSNVISPSSISTKPISPPKESTPPPKPMSSTPPEEDVEPFDDDLLALADEMALDELDEKPPSPRASPKASPQASPEPQVINPGTRFNAAFNRTHEVEARRPDLLTDELSTLVKSLGPKPVPSAPPTTSNVNGQMAVSPRSLNLSGQNAISPRSQAPGSPLVAPKTIISGDREEMIRPAVIANRSNSGMISPAIQAGPQMVECAMCHQHHSIDQTMLVKVRRVCFPCHKILMDAAEQRQKAQEQQQLANASPSQPRYIRKGINY